MAQDARATASPIADIKAEIDDALSKLITSTEPPELYEPLRHVLSSGGKRLRPALVLLTAQAFGAERSAAMPAALAVEVFHNFTLVHDDIMDNAPERRGRPTIQTKWDDGTAILTGDYLLSLSYSLIAQCRTDVLPLLLTIYHEMVSRLCEGQVLDAVFENRRSVSTTDYLQMIDFKTGALLSACMKMGGLIGNADSGTVDLLGSIGIDIGRAFQIKDDLLDLTAEDHRWGKKRGGDLIQGKKTFLLTRAMESDDPALRKWFSRVSAGDGLAEAELDDAEDRLLSAGIISDAISRIEMYSGKASSSIETLPQNEFTASLQGLVRMLRDRLH
ncbi:MAG: polyprenyl synthetase family protein [Rhodothermia bacterium]|nr:polyprenyl synthetase family protein [Rhodothermia bacterium]